MQLRQDVATCLDSGLEQGHEMGRGSITSSSDDHVDPVERMRYRLKIFGSIVGGLDQMIQ